MADNRIPLLQFCAFSKIHLRLKAQRDTDQFTMCFPAAMSLRTDHKLCPCLLLCGGLSVTTVTAPCSVNRECAANSKRERGAINVTFSLKQLNINIGQTSACVN